MKNNELLTPIKAIRAKCLDCSCWSLKEVALCPVTDCPIYPYRFGTRPNNEKDNKRMEYYARVEDE